MTHVLAVDDSGGRFSDLQAGLVTAGYQVGLILAYSNALDSLKSTQYALRRLMSDPLITDEPDLDSRAVAVDL